MKAGENMIVRQYIEEISPERAAQLLENNFEDNRRISTSWVDELADAMKQGLFASLNGQNRIIIGDDGLLYDGQHRCLAIIKSGVTLPFEIAVSNSPREDFFTFDNGRIRRAGQFVGIKNANTACSIAKNLCAIENGTLPLASTLQGKKYGRVRVSRVEITDYIEKHYNEVEEITSLAASIRNSINAGAPTVYGTFIGLIRFCKDDSCLDEFVDEIRDMFSNNATVIALREAIRKAYASKRTKPSGVWLMGILLNAYTHYKAHNNVVMLNKSMAYIDTYTKIMNEERMERNASAQKNDAV